LVGRLGVGDHTQPITKVVRLQVLLAQVFQVTFGEVNVGVNVDLRLCRVDRHVFAEVSDFSVDLDASLEELFELGDDHDAILHWVMLKYLSW
jgi:hypothetical protein